MKYLSLNTVFDAFCKNSKCTKSKFWGVLAILQSIQLGIKPGVSYPFRTYKTAKFLENLFCFKNKKDSYADKQEWYIMFSKFWISKISEQMCISTPNIYDVAVWFLRNEHFNDEANQKDCLIRFLQMTGLSLEQANELFNFDERQILFENYKYDENSLLKKLSDKFGNSRQYGNITSEGSFIVSNPGEFSRAPFIQTLYAAQQTTECLFLTQFSISEYYNSGKEMQTISNEPLQQIYYGAPGTGKSFTIDNLTDDDNSVRTTFHPDTDYASFVGAYKPTMKDMPLSAFVGKEVHRAQPQDGHPGTEQRIVYKYVPQAFLKAYVAAWSKLDTPYYLIIEEINRGNCAQIFGDLFQLLDRNNSGSSSYAINADEDIAKFLREDVNGFASLSQEQRDAIAAYELVKDNGESRAIGGKILDGTLLLLPHNLHIWATMNTSDQSLFPIDSAFKRRWNWKYVPIDTDPLDKRTQQHLSWKFEVAGNLYSWGKFLEFINPKIYDITESSDKQMGYFFAKADPTTGIISEEVFLNKVLFYLWTDVFKDYEVSGEIFQNKKNNNKPFRFTDFFEDADALANFIENCKLESEEIEPQNAEDEEKQSRRKPYTSLSVSFPDGTIVKEDTIFGTFRTAIEKIGLDKIADFAKSAPVMRKGLPIIDTQEQQVLLDANYIYEQVGNYFVLSQIKNVSYRKFLEEASKALNLNINITLE